MRDNVISELPTAPRACGTATCGTAAAVGGAAGRDPSGPDRLVVLHVEELHALGVHRERDSLAHLDLRGWIDPGHALARLRGRVLVLGARALGLYPGGIDGEVNHELRAEGLDQVHVADQGRPGDA